MSRAEELVELIRGRIHSEFDGECHLTDTEAHAIADFLSETVAALDEREISSGLTRNGNLWRFWADQARALVVKLSEAQQQVQDAKRIATNAEHYGYLHGLEKAAKTIEEGFDRGIESKHDLCAHKKFKWEDCESCAANAIRALIPSEPHDAEGRE